MLNTFGGFPEPLLSSHNFEKEKTLVESARWHKQYFSDIMREDILEFSRIHEINTMKLLIQLLRFRVGSPLSYNALAEDLQVSPNTIKKYIQILESLYIIFLIHPFHRNIARSLLKEPKVYFYDTAFIDGDEGIKLENTSAVCLLKYIQFQQDAKGEDVDLFYLKTKEKKEVDFVITRDDKPIQLVYNLLQNETVNNKNILKPGNGFPN